MNERDKAYFLDRVSLEMDQDLKAAPLNVVESLSLACRILAREGHESGLAGQVTARGERPGTWWTLQFGYGFDEASPERMVLVDEDLKPLSGGRPSTGKALKTIHMDSAMLHGAAHLAEWPGVPVADDEGRIISGALGDAKSILLANHGLLTTGNSVEEAAYLAVFFERAARMQLRAMAAGGFKEVKPELAAEARDFLLQPSIVRGTFAYWARRCG